jgi:predicted TIM-barrel fold metal-dependent hydrolase
MLQGGIIDAHVHAYPPEVAADPAGWALAQGEPGWSGCVAPKGRRSVQGWADTARMVADMDAAGVGCCVMLGWYWERQETCDLQNRWYGEWARASGGRLLAFACVQPRAGRGAVDALERALDGGFCGVGEVLPQAQGFTIDDPWWRRVVEVAQERGVPLTLHATDPGAGPAAGPKTPLEGYLRLAREHPRATFILAHWGGGMAFRGPPAGAGELPPNVYFDTAASPLLYPSDVFRRSAGLVGAGRILYGSDYPLILHPKRSREPDFSAFLGEIAASGLGEAELRQVLGGNARRLLAPGLARGPRRM